MRRWASAHSLPTPGTDEDLDVLDTHLRAASGCMGAGPAGGQAGPAPAPAKDLYRFAVGRSPYQRSPAPGCRR